jgi:hypothetical protein
MWYGATMLGNFRQAAGLVDQIIKGARAGDIPTKQPITFEFVITAARRPHSKAEYMTAPERFADSQIPLAPRAPSIHDPICDISAQFLP